MKTFLVILLTALFLAAGCTSKPYQPVSPNPILTGFWYGDFYGVAVKLDIQAGDNKVFGGAQLCNATACTPVLGVEGVYEGDRFRVSFGDSSATVTLDGVYSLDNLYTVFSATHLPHAYSLTLERQVPGSVHQQSLASATLAEVIR
ncbi:MAG: hypothetical protein SFU83_19505 [Meiothermus sp.]|nr:hypothetical protein [Meiothermus sp.]